MLGVGTKTLGTIRVNKILVNRDIGPYSNTGSDVQGLWT